MQARCTRGECHLSGLLRWRLLLLQSTLHCRAMPTRPGWAWRLQEESTLQHCYMITDHKAGRYWAAVGSPGQGARLLPAADQCHLAATLSDPGRSQYNVWCSCLHGLVVGLTLDPPDATAISSLSLLPLCIVQCPQTSPSPR